MIDLLQQIVTRSFIRRSVGSVALATRGQIPSNSGIGTFMAVFVHETDAVRQHRFLTLEDDLDRDEQRIVFPTCRLQEVRRNAP